MVLSMMIIARLLTLLALLTATPASAAPVTVKAMTFNICGVVCRHGEVSSTASYTASKITSQHVTVAFLEEVCYSQYSRLKVLVAKQGYSTAYVSQTNSGSCDNFDHRHGQGFGIAVVVKGPSWGRTAVRLPSQRGYEARNLLGVTARVGGRSTFVAAVHTAPSAKAGLDAQLAYLSKYLSETGPVIVGGDFNATPLNPGLTGIYGPSVGGTGKFTELDQCHFGCSSRSGAATFDTAGRKIDYLFVSQKYFSNPSGFTTGTVMSDHRIYVGTAQTA